MAEPQTAAIYYDERPGKPTLAATGAFGGPSPDGHNVIAHLFVEHSMVPSIAELEISEDGSARSLREIKRGEIKREIQASIVLTPKAAISIGTWLVNHGNTAQHDFKGK